MAINHLNTGLKMGHHESKKFQGYELLTHCGGGAYGDVWYCQDLSGKRLALKIISKSRLGEQWARELKGVQNYRKITEQEPGLLQIYHVGEDEEHFFYTMEPADDAGTGAVYEPDTLARRLEKGPLTPGEYPVILQEIFESIRAIHAAGYTHRDIKPDNILFVKGKPKLADIGLMSSQTVTATQLAGTLDFLPPEQWTGESNYDKQSRQQSDLYAFGKVIYCTITGNNPKDFPTIPPGFPLSNPLKFYHRLSLQLCNKDSRIRMVSLEKLESEIMEIQRKLLYGETFSDKWKYQLRNLCEDLKNLFHENWFLGKKYWYFVLLLLLCGGLFAYLLFKPEEPFDITQQKTKRYRNELHGFTMEYPMNWEHFSTERITELLSLGVNDKELQKLINVPLTKRVLEELKKTPSDVIYCDFTGNFVDSLSISVHPITEKQLREFTEEDLRSLIKNEIEKPFNQVATIYGVQKMMLNNRYAIAIEYSLAPEIFRMKHYWVAAGDQTIIFAVAAKNSTYLKRNEEFLSVITTLKEDKKGDL